MRPRDFLDVLEQPDLPTCEDRSERAELLRILLAHLFFVDRELDRRELAMLQRVLPKASSREYIASLATRRLDLDRLAELFPDAPDRQDIIRLAEHAAWGNDTMERREQSLIDRLLEKLQPG